MLMVALLAACGSPANPTANVTSTPAPAATPAATATPTPAPSATPAATVDELTVVASLVYPACTPANCAGDAMYTTCDAGSSGPDVFASCPLTAHSLAQIKHDVDGVPSAPDPLGGGQDPEWATETVTASPSSTGGIVHVTLGFGPGTTTEERTSSSSFRAASCWWMISTAPAVIAAAEMSTHPAGSTVRSAHRRPNNR